MPYNLLLLPLLGGFLFIHFAHLFRFKAQALDGYRLLFYSALSGFFLAVIARVFVALLAPTGLGARLGPVWFQFAPFPFSDTGVLSLILGPVCAALLNLFINAEQALDREIRSHSNAFTRLMHKAQREARPISVTLSNLKWYVGYVTETPNLSPDERYFRILPLVSGYRNRETLETFRTVFYEEVLQDPAIDKNDLVVTLPLEDVKIASLFDEDLYDEYFAEPDEPKKADDEP